MLRGERALPTEGCHMGKVCEVDSHSIVQRAASSRSILLKQQE